jgi:DUF1365 family protein
MSDLHSCLYTGWIRHRRFTPANHQFRYQVFMMYLDLQELEQVQNLSVWWSDKWYAFARFNRADFHGDPQKSLQQAVCETVKTQTGQYPRGPVRMLANWRYFGFNMNPLCTYYCFDPSGTQLEFILAEVTNTPWGQSHPYVLRCDPASTRQHFAFDKTFHVSPFNALDMRYQWWSTQPDKNLAIHIENWRRAVGDHNQHEQVMDATLVLERTALNATALRRVLIRYPLMTVKVIGAIYWQALRLWMKKVPFVGHPNNVPKSQRIEPTPKESFE